MLYGQRHEQDELWYLSPYESVTYWEPKLVKYPISVKAVDNDKYHATLTAEGKAKLAGREWREAGEDLVPGEDYAVKDGMPGVWWPYPDTPSTQSFRHTWVLCRRRRPKAPAFAGAPVPRHRGKGRANARR